ncbi:BTB/POZ domain-containing protein At2g13690-like [Chenopodium quinoa]|uniref:At3g05675-like ankyrin-like domain-containing protein n=1 Tax=Chenopodium quinoa TaxID=63459 RepID=A0A803KN88_CHEQI|nr:BTB/POZ domain-containing protein At2g13690-like [Chenopodium quinoa]
MDSYRNPQKGRRREQQSRRKTAITTTAKPSYSSWCCSFKSPPKSPETLSISSSKTPHKIVGPPISETLSKSLNSFPNSPQSSKSGLGIVSRIDRRRILSPGRVSPIDSDMIPPKISNVGQEQELSQELGSTRKVDLGEERENGGLDDGGVSEEEGVFDVRLSLKGKYGGGCLVLELNSKVLGENSCLFDGLIKNSKKNGGFCRIEVPEVENLGVFRETIELMFEDDITKKLIKIGAFRTIDILEVSASIKFNRGIHSCLKYLEAVPWTEEEEEKLRRLFTKFKFDDGTNNEIFSRLNLNDCNSPQQNLASQIVRSITTCGNAKARNELKSMVTGLLSKSSVYEKDYLDISKEDLYSLCRCSITSLISLFQEATDTAPLEQASSKKNLEKPLIESISWQVENINWLLEILLDRQMAEDFVDLWACQKDLLEMHQKASPMVRYELSRLSAVLFVAMGTRKLQCQAESRFGLLNSWFSPMLLDFGWLQRCRKGLNVRELEEAMGQSLLTLPLKQQYALFMEWFRCFSKHGTECPNLSKAFQIWWRRSFLRGSETHAIESR